MTYAHKGRRFPVNGSNWFRFLPPLPSFSIHYDSPIGCNAFLLSDPFFQSPLMLVSPVVPDYWEPSAGNQQWAHLKIYLLFSFWARSSSSTLSTSFILTKVIDPECASTSVNLIQIYKSRDIKKTWWNVLHWSICKKRNSAAETEAKLANLTIPAA